MWPPRARRAARGRWPSAGSCRPDGVKVGNVFGINEVTHPVWKDYLPQALQQGKLKCVPEPLVIGKGLESLQKGCDKNKEGVSAKKVVIEL